MSTSHTAKPDLADASEPARLPWTLWIGLAIIALCEVMLFIDVGRRGGLIVPYDALRSELPAPVGGLGWVVRWFAINMTALCWIGELLVFDGVLHVAGTPASRACALAAAPGRTGLLSSGW